jgi:hypothetical protein
MIMNQQTSTQSRNDYASRNQSTKFDLEALRTNDQQEIKNVANKYKRLSQTQKDLIRHQAPEAFSAINKIVESAYSANSEAHKHSNQTHDRSSNRASDERKNTFNSEKSRDEKRDSYEHTDRQHERDTKAQNDRHEKAQETTLNITKIAAVASVAIAAIVTAGKVFAGDKK